MVLRVWDFYAAAVSVLFPFSLNVQRFIKNWTEERAMNYRTEHDALGTKKVPDDAYYGIHTTRALENFQISGVTVPLILIHAQTYIKIAAAQVNVQLKLLDGAKARAIIRAGNEILKGKFDDQFMLDIFQAGAGTPINMNVNEVIANRANEILGVKKGSYTIIHPNDHVNMSQSSNDSIPTAIRIAALWKLQHVTKVLEQLERSFAKKGKQFNTILKSGRTHLHDAVPITLGQEFSAYSAMLQKHMPTLAHVAKVLLSVHLGGTAIGTGFNTHPNFRKLAVQKLAALTKLRLVPIQNSIQSTQSMSDFALLGNILKVMCIDLTKICNDLRLMSAGPQTGIAEITLPAVEPGSSIMPGKINPSIVECMNMICFQVMGNAAAIDQAAQAGQFELNVMTPVIAHNLLQSLDILIHGMKMLDERCVRGIKANPMACSFYFEHSMGTATVLSPYLGYEQTAELVKESQRTGITVQELAIKKKLLSAAKIKELFAAQNLTKPNLQKQNPQKSNL